MQRRRTAEFTAKQEAVAALLASGSSVREAAAQTNTGERTVFTWRAEPEFVKLVGEYRAKIIDEALGKLAGTAVEAVECLKSCLKSPDGDSVRLRAALGVLDQLIRIRELVDIEERLSELERNAPKCH